MPEQTGQVWNPSARRGMVRIVITIASKGACRGADPWMAVLWLPGRQC